MYVYVEPIYKGRLCSSGHTVKSTSIYITPEQQIDDHGIRL